MHASHTVLMHLPALEGDDPSKWTKAQIAHAKEQAGGELSSLAERYFDENNWYQEEVLILRNGKLLQMAKSGDWRGRDSMYGHVKEKSKELGPWEYGRKFALQCVLKDMSVGGATSFSLAEKTRGDDVIENSAFDALVKMTLIDVPTRLRVAYEKIIDIEPPKDGWDNADYERSSLAEQFEIFRSSLEKHSNPPFVSGKGCNPYSYRAHDWSHGNFPNAMLLVDVHT